MSLRRRNPVDSAHAIHVLIVEDDRTSTRVAAAICEALGCVPYIARNGLEALQLYDTVRIDIVFLDLQMPGMGGLETAFELRQAEQELGNPPLPIIAVTGENVTSSRMRCLSAGMNDCVAKPYAPELVRQMLECHVRGYHADAPATARDADPIHRRII